MEMTIEHDLGAQESEAQVFSLTTILDPSAAIEAANRLYARNRAGLRFFCENRRVVSVDEAAALEGLPEMEADPA